ncbi:putative bifunctional diguanylate cyclase/phosphodiesterase [Hydrogenimonas sp.]
MFKTMEKLTKRLGKRKKESEALHRFVREQTLLTLCRKVPVTMSATIIVATSFFIFVWPYVDRDFLTFWYGSVLFLAFERIFYAFGGCRYGESSLEKRYRRFRIEIVLMALLWAFAAFAFFPEGSVEYELLHAIIILGVSAGGAITLAIDRRMADTYIVLLLSSLAARLLICGDLLHTILFVMALVFMAVFLISTRQLSRILEKGIRQHGELGELRRRFDLIADQAPVGILYFDKEYNIVDCNRALARQIGVSKKRIMEFNLLRLQDQRPVKNIRKVIEERESIHYGGPYRVAATGREIWISILFSPLYDQSEELIGGIAVVQDKTAEYEAMEKAEFLAYHDSLTRLPNRKLLEDRYRLQIAQATRENYFSALLFLDLDKFKHINDTYGHKVGDELLKETAHRLQKILRQSDTVCRLGGDEFIIFLPMISTQLQESVEHTWQVCRKIHRALGKIYRIDEHRLYVTTSIGVVMIYGKEESLDEVLRVADIAMYHAKKRGTGMTSFYEEEMDRQLKYTIELEQGLRHAIDRKEFSLRYQPIVDIANGKIHGAEALLRWKSPEGNMIPPNEFIPVAEESKLIHQIGHWVIEEVCRHLAEWHKKSGFSLAYISINISSKQLNHQGFFDEVMQIVENHGVDPHLVKFEITESVLMEENERTRDVIAKFNEAGIGFMIDDFGTGYSSLSYLKQFDFETIKIDKSFIRDILTDEDDVTLVQAMLDIAKQFGYTVIAEGVETDEQKNRLKTINETMLCQGYFYSRPLTEEDFLKRIGVSI